MEGKQTKSRDISLRAKIGFIVGGSAIGLLLVNFLAAYLMRGQDTATYGSIQEFRDVLSNTADPRLAPRSDGSLPFAAIVEPHPSDDIIYTLRRNFHGIFTGVQTDTNSLGMRNEEVSPGKPVDTYRIALMGDSFVFGWGVPEKETFGRVMESELNKNNSAKRVQVLNFGIPGYSTFQEVALFKERALPLAPDAVVVFMVDNDFQFPFFIRDESSSSGLVQSFSLGRLGSRVVHPLLERQKTLMAGRDPNSSLSSLATLCAERGIPVFLVVNPRKDWRGIIRNLKVLRDKRSITLLPIGEDFEKIVAERGYTQEQMNLPNDPHPTPLRHRIYGELMAARIAPRLPR